MQPFQKLTATRGRLLLLKEETEVPGLEEHHLHRGSEQGCPDLKMAAPPPWTPTSRTTRHQRLEGGEKEEQVEASVVAAAACARDGGGGCGVRERSRWRRRRARDCEREVGDGGVREWMRNYADWWWSGGLRGRTASARWKKSGKPGGAAWADFAGRRRGLAEYPAHLET
jgi:hypothetical protein